MKCWLYYTSTCWMLTSQPFGVVLDCAQNRATFSQTSVNHGIARQEVCHGGWVEITTWEKVDPLSFQENKENPLLLSFYFGRRWLLLAFEKRQMITRVGKCVTFNEHPVWTLHKCQWKPGRIECRLALPSLFPELDPYMFTKYQLPLLLWLVK